MKSAADVFSITGITLAGPPAAELQVWITLVPCKFSRDVKVVVVEGIVGAEVAAAVAVLRFMHSHSRKPHLRSKWSLFRLLEAVVESRSFHCQPVC